jgi:hypothetical protein
VLNRATAFFYERISAYMISHNQKKHLLIERIKTNYNQFQLTHNGVSREKLIKMAGRIAAVTDAYEMLTKEYEWNDIEEIELFLLFRDPLTIISDALEHRRNKLSNDFYHAMGDIMHGDYKITEYPFIEGIEGHFYNNIVYRKK